MAYHHLAYVYDRLMEDTPYEQWLAWLEASVPDVINKKLEIIDLGCGTGNIAIPLAKRGHQVTGVDLSAEMLAVAQEKMREHRLEITWTEQDMSQLSAHPADLIVCFCDSLNYLLEESQVAATFHCVFEHLRPGGSFLFDVHSPHYMLETFGNNTFTWLDEDVSYIWNCYLDPQRLEVEHQLTFFLRQPNGLYRRLEEVHWQRAYQPISLVGWLREAGFEEIVITADFRHQPPEEHSQRLFFRARRPDIDNKEQIPL